MGHAARHFPDAARQRIATAVRDAEARTSAEIVPVVASASGRYDRAEDLVGLITGLGVFVVAWMLFQREDPTAGGWDGLPLTLSLPILVGVLLAGYGAGVLVATRVHGLRRWFTPRAMRMIEPWHRATQLFYGRRIHHAESTTGVLVYVSLFERRAVILADRVVLEAIGQEAIDAACASLTADLRTGDVPAALATSIAHLGDLLAAPLPREGDDDNELPDALIVLD